MDLIPSGVVSSTATFFPDILDMAQEAAERAGIDFTSGQALRSARMSLDIMSQEWANEGLNLWTIDSLVTPLQPGISLYNLPADTIDVISPVLRQTTNGALQDSMLSRIDVAGYAAIPNKLFSGNRPSQIYVDRQAKAPTFTVWPVPIDQTCSVLLYRMRRMRDTSNPTNSMDIPARFVPAMIAGLSYKMAQKSRDQVVAGRVQALKEEYRDLLDKARYEDTSRTPLFLTPLVY